MIVCSRLKNAGIILLAFFSVVKAAPGAMPSNQELLPPAIANLVLAVNNNSVDAPDGNPGDQVCETAFGNGICTLRAAIMETNAVAGLDRIIIPAFTITLTRVGYDDTASFGDLDILDHLIIEGSGISQTIIDGDGAAVLGRVFQVAASVQASLSNLTIQDGNGPQNTAEFRGGGIYNAGDLSLDSVHLYQNAAEDVGGVANYGKLMIRNSNIEDNTATVSAGGIFNAPDGLLEIDGSHITLNEASQGGGIFGGGTIKIVRSTLSNNTAEYGAGIYLYQSPSGYITDSTLHHNHATIGGGIYTYESDLAIVNSTISSNSSKSLGGGIWFKATPPVGMDLYNVSIVSNYSDADDNGSGTAAGILQYQNPTGTITMANSILANNFLFNIIGGGTPEDCYATLNSLGYNLVETTSADCSLVGILTGNKTGLDPVLGTLGDNGGVTLTHALLAGSPAIDAGNPAGCLDAVGNPFPFDQRQYLRHFDGGIGSARCDIGAYEYLAPEATRVWLPVLFR